MTDLTSTVLGELDQPKIEAIAQQLGIGPAQAQSAAMQALPLLLGGLARNASTSQGADSLHNALQKDHAGVDLGALLGSVLGGGGAGEAILGHIFGGRRDQAAQGLGQTSGLGASDATRLLAMLAPLVLGVVLGRMNSSQHMTSSGLSGVLGQEAQRTQQTAIGGLLASVFGSDGDGQSDLGGILKAGQ